jgi:hypothetical protein
MFRRICAVFLTFETGLCPSLGELPRVDCRGGALCGDNEGCSAVVVEHLMSLLDNCWLGWIASLSVVSVS